MFRIARVATMADGQLANLPGAAAFIICDEHDCASIASTPTPNPDVRQAELDAIKAFTSGGWLLDASADRCPGHARLYIASLPRVAMVSTDTGIEAVDELIRRGKRNRG